MSCECYEQMNQALKEKGLRMPATVVLNKGRVERYKRAALLIERAKPRAKMPTVFATFCPMCGKAYS